MATGKEQATFSINLEGNAAQQAAQVSDAMAALKKRVTDSQNAIKQYNSSLKNLTGSSDEVKKAKGELKAKIDAEKQAISANTLEVLKLSKENENLKKSTSDVAKSTQGSSEIMGAFKVAAVGVATGILAITTAAAGAAVSLGKFIIKGADGARSAALLREAAFGANPQWGKNFGEQVAALAQEVPQSREELDKLGISLAKQGIGGQLWVDTMHAVTQAAAALGDDAGSKIESFITRGKMLGNFQLNPQEMMGTGVNFNEVAEQLAKSMNVGIEQAKQALFEGRVKIGDGAEALRKAVEKKFGALNLRQLMSLENLTKRLTEAFDDLTKGVNLEPMLQAFKELGKAFGANTVAGNALRTLITTFGNALVTVFVASVPYIKKFIYGLIIGALQLELKFFQLRKTIRDTFANSDLAKSVDFLQLALKAGEYAAYGVAVAIAAVGAVLALGVAQVAAFTAAFVALPQYLREVGETIGKTLKNMGWEGVGKAIIDGILAGFKNSLSALAAGVTSAGDLIKNTFKDALGIHSPSKVFEGYGQNTTEGFTKGVDKGSPEAVASLTAMAAPPKGAGAPAAAAAAPTVNVTINVTGGKDAQATASAISSASVIEAITKAVIDAVHGAGAGVPA